MLTHQFFFSGAIWNEANTPERGTNTTSVKWPAHGWHWSCLKRSASEKMAIRGKSCAIRTVRGTQISQTLVQLISIIRQFSHGWADSVRFRRLRVWWERAYAFEPALSTLSVFFLIPNYATHIPSFASIIFTALQTVFLSDENCVNHAKVHGNFSIQIVLPVRV